jgi:uncharacterized membrane protein YkvA (DUF1232 family)
MNYNEEKAQQVLDIGTKEAEEMIRDSNKMDELLAELEEKLKAVPKIGKTLADLPLMVAMVKGWITQEYTQVSPKVIACLVGAIIYLVKQKDLISDKIPIIGYVDDIAVLGLALKLSEPELKAFSEWRAAKKAGTAAAAETDGSAAES